MKTWRLKQNVPFLTSCVPSLLVLLAISTSTQASVEKILHEPCGLIGSSDPLQRAFTLIWEPVKFNSDGTAASGIITYNIYRRDTPKGPAIRINNASSTLPVFADRVNRQKFYYTVRSVNESGVESKDSLMIDSTLEANLIVFGSDDRTQLLIPSATAIRLRSNRNSFGVPLTVQLVEGTTDDPTDVVRAVQIQILRSDRDEPVEGFSLPLAEAHLRVGYTLIDGHVALESPQTQGHQAARESTASPNQLTLYWFNGLTWINVGGLNNSEDQTIETKTSQIGKYEVRIAAANGHLNLTKASVYPPIFTPNGDGYNDEVYFVFDNPTQVEVKGQIWDIQGRHIAELTIPTAMPGGSALSWNGKTSEGAIAPAGIYAYLIDGEGKKFSGTVTVAR